MTLLKAGTMIDNKYVLVRLLGEGGMGSVWQCRHQVLGAPFAIKFLHPERASGRSRERFVREARAAACLQTRHVVRVYDHGVEHGHPFIVMELLEGEDLGARDEAHARHAGQPDGGDLATSIQGPAPCAQRRDRATAI